MPDEQDPVEALASRRKWEIELLPGGVRWLHRPRKVDAQLRGLALGDALCALAAQTNRSVLVAPDVARVPVQLELTQATWPEVVAAAAASTGAAVHDLGDVMVVTSGALPGPAARWERLRRATFPLEPQPGDPKVSLDLKDTPLLDALEALSRQAGRPVVLGWVATDLHERRLTLGLTDVPWRTATLVVARLVGLAPVPTPDGGASLEEPVVVQARRADGRGACLLLARCDRRTLAIGSSLTGELTAELWGVTPARALELSAALLGHALLPAPGGGWRIGRSSPEVPAEEPLEAALAAAGRAARGRDAAALEQALRALAALPARGSAPAVSALVARGPLPGALLAGRPALVDADEAPDLGVRGLPRLRGVEPGRATLTGPGGDVTVGLSAPSGPPAAVRVDAEEPAPAPASRPRGSDVVPAERRALRVDVDVEEAGLNEVMGRLSEAAGWPIAVAPLVSETVIVNLHEISWLDAAEVVARMCRCRLRASPSGALSVEPGPPMDGVTFADEPLDRAALALGQAIGRTAVVAPGAPTRVGLAGGLEGDEEAGALAAAAGLEAIQGRGWLLMAPRIDAPHRALLEGDPTPALAGDPIDLDLSAGASGKTAAEALGAALGRPIVLDPALDETPVRLRFRAVPRAAALEHLAALTGGEPREVAGALTIVRPPRVALHLRQAPLRPVLEALIRRGGLEGPLPCELAPGLEGEVSLVVQGVTPREAVGLVAAAAGLRVERPGRGFRLSGTAALAEPAPPLPDPRLDPLLADLEEAARAGARDALSAAALALRDRLSGLPTAAERERIDALALELALLIRATIGLAEAREVEELVTVFTQVRELIGAHPDGPGLLRQLLDGPDAARLADLGEVRLSFLLQSWVTEGNGLLRAMSDAIQAERPGDVPALRGKLDTLLLAMQRQEREVFHRNAAALEVRAESLAKQAKRLAAALPRVPALRGTVSWSDGLDGVALLSDAAVVEGASAGAAKLVEVRPGVVRLRVGEDDLVRMVR